MKRQELSKRIKEIGIIPSIRVSTAADAHFAAEAIVQAGIPIVTITLTVQGALEVIRDLVRNGSSKIIVGAGGVWDAEAASKCLDAGVQFLTSTGFDPEIVAFARKHDLVVFPGAMTPTEVTAAWKSGPDFVKLFPCAALGGPAYVKALRQPFPEVPFIASGGVNQQNAADYILAGADVLGISTELIQPKAISSREAAWIHELSKRFLGIVQKARTRT